MIPDVLWSIDAGKAAARAVVSGSKARSCGSWDGTEGMAVGIALACV